MPRCDLSESSRGNVPSCRPEGKWDGLIFCWARPSCGEVTAVGRGRQTLNKSARRSLEREGSYDSSTHRRVVYIPSSFILTSCAVLSCDLSGENGPVCQAQGGVATSACPGSLEVAAPIICIYICGASVTSCWRMRASFIHSCSAVPSHGRSRLSAEVHEPVLWEGECRVFAAPLQTSTRELREQGRRQRRRWGALERKRCCVFVRNVTSRDS